MARATSAIMNATTGFLRAGSGADWEEPDSGPFGAGSGLIKTVVVVGHGAVAANYTAAN